MVKIAPSVLSADFALLKEDIDTIYDGGKSWIHYDVMDGHFVPNISFGYSILSNLRSVTDLFIDVHLMITDPGQYLDEFINAGADLITFHIEAVSSMQEARVLIQRIHDAGCLASISIKTCSFCVSIQTFLDDLDMVLVMSVEPGFGGQSFNPAALDKITELKEIRNGRRYLIEVDGGINANTANLCRVAGADVLVAGSYVFKAENRQEAIDSLK